MTTNSPDATISISCNHGGNHGKPTKIATMRPFSPLGTNALADADEWSWAPGVSSRRRDRLGDPLPDGSQQIHMPQDSTAKVEYLIDDEPYDLAKHGIEQDAFFMSNGRRRFSFRCTRCNLGLVVRGEKLDAALWRMRHAGITEVELSALGAIVR